MRKIFTLLFATLMVSLAYSQSTTLVISQIYGGAGCGTAGCSTFQNDFIEIFNKSSSPISLNGYSVQYNSATGTGAFQVTLLPNVTLNPGQYFLVAESGNANGVNPLPTPDVTGTIAMSATAGRVALVNGTTALPGTGCPPATAGTIIDFVGFGATANCNEGGANAPAPSTTTACMRASNGCQDTQNNGSDFTSVTPTPRNTASATNSCGGPTAFIGASPNITNITASLGVASASQSYNLSASNLTPTSGNIVVTPSAGLEVSLDNTSFSTTAINVPYSAGGITPAIPIYVRISASAPQGAISGSVTNAGGSAPTATVTVSGGVFTNYYSQPTGNLDVLGTWGSNTDGSGAAPSSFTAAYQIFNVVNRASGTITGNWDIAGTNSKVVVGDGTNPTTLTVPPTAFITTTSRIDVNNNGTLRLENNTRPFLGSLNTGSTVNFAQTGTSTTDTIRIPNISYYNLAFTSGLKYFSSGTTTIRGNFIADGVAGMNGAGSPFSTVNAFGNLTFLNGTVFDPLPAGDNARFTLAMNGSGTQTITGNGTDLLLFRLRRDTTSSSVDIVLTPGTDLVLGNNAGGGLQLNQGTTTTTVLQKNNNNLSLIGAAVSTNTSNGLITSTGGTITINKTLGTSTAGTLRFDPTDGPAVEQFIVNFDPAQTRDSIVVIGGLTVETGLTLTRGRLVVPTGNTLFVSDAATLTGGSATSFIDGNVRRSGNSSLFFPVGKANKYAPVQIANMNGFNNYTVQYFNTGFGSYGIDPTTQATYPNYSVSGYEYWTIDQGDLGTCDITFNYSDINSLIQAPLALRMAHFDGSDWDDIGGTPGVSNTTTSGSVTVTGVSEFSPFTFAAVVGNVIPVRISSFTAQKRGNDVQLNWTTAQEINSRHFVVQRSTGNGNWISLGTINAAGNSSTLRNYSFTDQLPTKGINLYRLLQVDNDGKGEYSVTRSVLFSSKSEVAIAPNPASSFINVFVATSSNEAYTVQLLDANGRILKTLTSREARVQLPVSGLQKGVYVVKVTEGNTVTNHKVLVQ